MAMVDKLSDRALVERHRGADKRSNALHLTPAGMDACAQAERLADQLDAQLLGWLDKDTEQMFLAAIDAISDRARR